MNNLVTITDGQAVTTTLAIADGTEVQHKNVLDLVRTYRTDLEEFGSVAFETRPRPAGQHGGADVEFANLNEQQATLLLTYMRNSDIVRGFKKRLVKAFYELAQRARSFDPSSMSRLDLLKLAIDAEQERIVLADQVKVLSHEVEVMEPKAEFVDRFVIAEGLYGLDNAARALNVPCRKFTRMLVNDGYLFYEGGVLVPYAKHKSKGWFEVKSPIIEDKPRPRTFITPAGFLYFANLIRQGELFPELKAPENKPSVVAKALDQISKIVGGPRPGLNGASS